MLTDFIRSNAIAIVTGFLVGTATLGTGTLYVVYSDAPRTIVQDKTRAVTPLPSRFVFNYSGKVGLEDMGRGARIKYEPIMGERSKVCDLTVEADASCSMEVGKYGVFPHIAVLARHAGDPTLASLRIRTPGGSEPLTGLTVRELIKGVSYEGGTYSIRPLDPMAVSQ